MNLEIWKQLYEVTKKWNQVKPWIYINSDDFIKIDYPDDSYYCSIMGQMSGFIGLSVYKGEEGFGDLCSIRQHYENDHLISYLMWDQNYISFYMGDRLEVPKQQKQIMKELNLRFRGRGNWPYFLSQKKHYALHDIDEDEALLLTKVMEQILDIIDAYCKGSIDVRFEEDEMIHAYQEDNKWKYEAICYEEVDKFIPLVVSDEDLLSELKQTQSNDVSLILDLVYIPTVVNDKHFSRPVVPLFLLAVDEKEELILTTEAVHPEESEYAVVLGFLINYILNEGRPHEIIYRNPAIWSALAGTCHECDIELLYDEENDLLDDIIEGMLDFF